MGKVYIAGRICACLALLSVAALCGSGVWLVLDARKAVLRLEAQASAAIGSLPVLLDARTAELTGTIDRQAAAITRAAGRQITATRTEALARVDVGIVRLDGRIGEALGEVRALRSDARPVLASADELLQQASGTVAVLRPQLLGTIAATKVTMGAVAQASRRIDAALPAALVTWQQLGTQTVGISTDVHAFTSKFTAPKSTKAKIWGGVTTAIWGVSRFR